jgi:hypothetical protein
MRDSVTSSKAVSPPTSSSPSEFLAMAGRERRRRDSFGAANRGFSAGNSGEKGEPGRNSEASGLKEKCLGEFVGLRRKPFDEYGGASVEVLEMDCDDRPEVLFSFFSARDIEAAFDPALEPTGGKYDTKPLNLSISAR